uniref:Cytochrome c oxidase subunit 2 n=1 Tax=Armillifer agkistrodontis TaxID=592791 RepID=A0A1J0CYI0_ARMAG|nr:cytochrome c oxidase subunit II [Armillifer agkistrodontis]APB92067.1 cytochrome c oxidase subunit II [Armillifer agkistrodontis]
MSYQKMTFQNSASPIMEHLISFHDYILIILYLITTMIFYVLLSMITNKYLNQLLINNQVLEFIWTSIPALILTFIMVPSLHILYLLDETTNPLLTVKIMGHQWYWSYEYSDFKNIQFDSYMISNNPLLRLLDTNNRLTLPFSTLTRLLISSYDVLHSWTMPSLGAKIDAIPGRLNQLTIFIQRPGIFFGQCSEICGINHSFMPISLQSVNTPDFISWLYSM